jgi:hypothetical protein
VRPDGGIEVRLKRNGPPSYEPAAIFDWKEWRGESPAGPEAFVHFEKYGTGSDNTSSFQVFLTWGDVETLIAVFAKMDCPPAVRLKRANQLAAAVENVIKNSN